MQTDRNVIEAIGVVRDFPGTRALDNVDFSLRSGEIHSLVGENGAGKSTLIKVLTGVHQPTSGRLALNGRPMTVRHPLEAQRLGISTVYQEVDLIPDLSIAENILLGRHPKWFGLINWRAIRRRAKDAMHRLRLDVDVTRPLRSCSIALQQMVAIARAVDLEARVLILDEPTSSLDQQEVTELFNVMRHLRAEGIGIIFISHFLDQIEAISDRITVLRNGRRIGTYERGELSRLELIAKMIGREFRPAQASSARSTAKQRDVSDQPPLMSAHSLGRRGEIEPVNLAIAQGEVFGLAGLLGSGRSEIARLLFGIDRATSGDVRMRGRCVRLRSPRDAMAGGIGMVPEDRKVQGVLAALTVRENLLLPLQVRRGWFRRLANAMQEQIVDRFMRELNIVASDPNQSIRTLSGGNQQKVMLARWLAVRPELLILDEPTRGIDVGAKVEVENLVSNLRREGMSVLFISSELEEVARDCDRVLVLRDRRAVGELDRDDLSVDRIMETIATGGGGGGGHEN